MKALICVLVVFALFTSTVYAQSPIKIALTGGGSAAMREKEDGQDMALGSLIGAKFSAPAPGLRRLLPDALFSLTFLINFAEEVDVNSEFGSFILTPRQDTRSLFIESGLVLGKIDWLALGLIGRLEAASATFVELQEDEEEIKQSLKGDVFYPLLGLTGATPEWSFSEGKIQFGIEAGFTWRRLGGDVGQGQATEFRRTVMGMEDKRVLGVEFGGYLMLNTTRTYVKLSWLNADKDVSGLTDLRILFGMDALTNIFSFASGPEE